MSILVCLEMETLAAYLNPRHVGVPGLADSAGT